MSESIKYFVNTKKKMVVAVLEGTEYDAKDILIKNPYLSFRIYDDDKLKMKYKYVGKAKCASEDEFDINVGKKLARMRLLEKYYRDLSKVMSIFHERYVEKADEILRKTVNKYNNIVDEMSELEERIK